MTTQLFSSSVAAQRRPGSRHDRDYFPTPPWATRAVLPILRRIDPDIGLRVIWEPAAGQGHMAVPLAESGAVVVASDIEVRPWAAAARDALLQTGGALVPVPLDFLKARDITVAADWVITNPPFNRAAKFVARGLEVAHRGVAVLVRTAWAEGAGRYESLFRDRPPTLIAQYVERVPMTVGRWDPAATTATAYAWFIWDQLSPFGATQLCWIPPGQKAALHRADDVFRFDAGQASPLFPAQV